MKTNRLDMHRQLEQLVFDRLIAVLHKNCTEPVVNAAWPIIGEHVHFHRLADVSIQLELELDSQLILEDH